MANNDGEINIKTKIDNTDLEKGLKETKGKLNDLSGKLKTGAKLGAAFSVAAVAIKATAKAIGETVKAYETQKKAEIQLEQAAKNNPYLDSRSVKQLKQYASELQTIGTIGDEVLLPQMAQLASAGRTQEEIQKIMSAALDVSASGMMSLDSAVQQLNASYSGNVGMLGRQIGELKNLTKEELESGRAVDIIADKFKGMAAETAKATGTSEQLKNAWGDLKEEIGAGFEKPLSSVRRFFTELISGWTEAAKARREYAEAEQKIEDGAANSADYETVLKQEEERLDELKNIINDTMALLEDEERLAKKTQESRGYYTKDVAKKYLSDTQKAYERQLKTVEDLNKKLKEQQAQEKQVADEANKAAEAERKKAEAAARNKSASDIMNENQAALDRQLEQMRIEAELKGEEINKQEVLNALMASYVSLVTTSSLVTENNPFSKKRLAELKEYAKGVSKLDENYADLMESIKEFLGEGEETPLSDSINATIEALKAEQSQLKDTSDAWQEYAKKIEDLEKLKTQVIKKEEENALEATKENAVRITEQLNGYINQFADIVGTLTNLMSDQASAENDAALADISEQYTEGLISYEEYCDKKTEIARKQANDEYKIQLWTWTASILQATANIAQGVSKAIAEGGVAGIITGALVGAAGAAQIASIVASKPQPPKFAGGGIVGGSSYTGDHVNARLNSGEMVLNAAQQSQLWKTANGTGGGGVSLNVDITNNMADSARVSSQLTSNGLRVTIDRLVNAGLKEGRYSQSLAEVENSKNGVRYL